MRKGIECWHFAAADRRLDYDDGRLIKVGAVHEINATPKCCVVGLHGSIRAIDALGNKAGPIVSRVRISGAIDQENDKLCGKRREYLAVADAKSELRSFARWCALQMIHQLAAPAVVRKYLETGDESIRTVARDAAMDAARDAARDAVLTAERSAAWSAVWAAASNDASRAASWNAAMTAVWNAERHAARPVVDAARTAAWDAARAAQNIELERRLRALLKLEPDDIWPRCGVIGLEPDDILE